MLQKLQSGAWMPSRWAKQRPVITGGCLAHTVFQPSRLHPGPDEVSWLVQVATLDTHHLPHSQSHPLSSPSLPLQDLGDLSLFSFMRDAISLSLHRGQTLPLTQPSSSTTKKAGWPGSATPLLESKAPFTGHTHSGLKRSNPGMKPNSVPQTHSNRPRKPHSNLCSAWPRGQVINTAGFPSLSQGFPGGSDDKASACNAGDPGSIPGSGRSPGEGNGNPLQYSCLENSMD